MSVIHDDKVEDMEGMFANASIFNQDLDWNTENVTDMSNMFLDAKNFKGRLSFTTTRLRI